MDVLRRRYSWLVIVVFFFTLLGESAYCYFRALATPDTLAYASIADATPANSFAHEAATCSQFVKSCPPPTDDNLRVVSKLNPSQYGEFLRMYRVKPLFNSLTDLLHTRLRLNPFKAMRLISSASFALIGLLVFFWLLRFFPGDLAAILMVLIMALPGSIALGKSLTPDAFATLPFLVAVYALTFGESLWPGVILLLVADMARPDCMIAGVAVLVIRIIRGSDSLGRKLAKLTSSVGLLLIVNLLTQHYLHAISWQALYLYTFVASGSSAETSLVHLTLREYLRAEASLVPKVVIVDLMTTLFLAGLALLKPGHWTPMKDLVVMALVVTVFRLLIFPNMEERFYTWMLYLAAIGASLAISRFEFSAFRWPNSTGNLRRRAG